MAAADRSLEASMEQIQNASTLEEENGLLLLAKALSTHLGHQIEEVTEEISRLEATMTQTSAVPMPAEQQPVVDGLSQPDRGFRPVPRPRGLTPPLEPLFRPSPQPMRRVTTSTPRVETLPGRTPKPRSPPVTRLLMPPVQASTAQVRQLNLEAPQFSSAPAEPTASQHVHPPEMASLQIARKFKKPVIEIETFGGDPTCFTQFCRHFNARIVNNTDSYDECLSYLVQYTTGEANRVVQGYAH